MTTGGSFSANPNLSNGKERRRVDAGVVLTMALRKMKWNKSSEVIPLRPHISDVKETRRTDCTCLLSRLKNRHSLCNFLFKLFLWSCYSAVHFFPNALTGEISWCSHTPNVTVIITAVQHKLTLSGSCSKFRKLSNNFIYLKYFGVGTRQERLTLACLLTRWRPSLGQSRAGSCWWACRISSPKRTPSPPSMTTESLTSDRPRAGHGILLKTLVLSASAEMI